MEENEGLTMVGAMVLFMVGAVMLGWALFRREGDGLVLFVLAVGGVVCFGTGLLMTICVYGPRVVDLVRQGWYARAETEPRIVLIEHLKGVDKETMRLMNHYVGVLTAIGGTAGPVWMWGTLDGHSVPFEFMREFVLGSKLEKGRYWLQPIRTWGEGSFERALAEELTAHFISVGLARKPVGHYPAEWIDFDAALRWTGLEKEWK